MNPGELKELIDEHDAWFLDRTRGRRLELKDADLTGVNLANVRLAGAHFERVKFDGSVMTSAILDRSMVVDCSFDGANLTGASFEDGQLQGVHFVNTIMANASLSYLTARDCVLKGVQFEHGFLVKSHLHGVIIESSALHGANLLRVMVQGGAIARCDLSDTDLTKAEFTDADLRETNMAGATLLKTRLVRVKVYGLHGPVVDLQGCLAVESDFSEAGDGSRIRDEADLFRALSE